MQDVFDKIASASATKSGNDFQKGKYRLLIEKVTIQTTRKHEIQVIPEFRVVAAEKVEAGVEPNPVGSSVRCIWNVSKHDAAPGNVKAFVLGVLGRDESTTSEKEVKELTAMMVGADQPFRGLAVDATTVTRINQGRDNPANKGKEMVLPNWQHVPGQSQESLARNRAILDGAAPTQTASAPPAAPVTPPPAPPAAAPSGFGISNLFGK